MTPEPTHLGIISLHLQRQLIGIHIPSLFELLLSRLSLGTWQLRGREQSGLEDMQGLVGTDPVFQIDLMPIGEH